MPNSSGGRTFVMWLRAGHEVRQESKSAVFDLLTRLADPSSSIPTHNAEEETERKGKKEEEEEKVSMLRTPCFRLKKR